MPSAFTRYITWELLRIFLLALGVITFLMVVQVLVREALQMNLGIGPTLRLIPFALPNALAFSVPGTILFAVCVVFGRMSADNEIVALKALGMSPWIVLKPALVLGFLLSLLSVWLLDVAYSWGYLETQRVIIQSVEDIAYGMLKTQKSYSNKQFSIIVKGVDGKKLLYPIMTFNANGDTPPFTLTADEAQLKSNLDRNTILLTLTNSELQTGNGVTASFPGIVEREIPLTLVSAKDATVGPAHLSMRQLPDEVQKQQKLIRTMEQVAAAELGFQLSTGDFSQLHQLHWNAHQDQLRGARKHLIRLRLESWRRWSAGFSCLCFVMVGAPLAIYMKSSDFMQVFFFSFGPCVFWYFMPLVLVLDRVKAGALPPITLWLPNVVLAAAGCFLIYRVQKY